MGVVGIPCTYASVCIVIRHVPSRSGFWIEQTVIKIPSKRYNERTRDHPPGGGGGGANSDVSVNASYNHVYVLFMYGDHFQDS